LSGRIYSLNQPPENELPNSSGGHISSFSGAAAVVTLNRHDFIVSEGHFQPRFCAGFF
jgi:hypothetical protein